jgi:polyphosphate kinase
MPKDKPVKSPSKPHDKKSEKADSPPNKSSYNDEIYRLQVELVKMQEWVRATGARVAVIFEGRDAAGKGGTIARIMEHLNPRVVRIAALPKPTDREQSEWYFQRYVNHLPAGGEVVIFDRSWYNRAGVEIVFGFCTPEQHRQFLEQCPVFERLLIDDGIILVKYWFSVSDDEQEKRFKARMEDPLKRWKLSPVDLPSRAHWVDYSRAKDTMFDHTDTVQNPWWVVEGDDKKKARINCITHLLSQVPYHDVFEEELVLPKRQKNDGYKRPDESTQNFVPDVATKILDQAR